MENKSMKKWSSRSLSVRVTNRVCGRVDVHKNISQEEAEWIAVNPNLDVEYIDFSRQSRERDE